MRRGWWAAIVLVIFGIGVAIWYACNVAMQPQCTNGINRGFFRHCSTSCSSCSNGRLPHENKGCDGQTISQDCHNRIQWLKNNWNNGNYNFPNNPTEAHFQRYLAACEGFCCENIDCKDRNTWPCTSIGWTPKCNGDEVPTEPGQTRPNPDVFRDNELRVMTWNVMSYCMQREPSRIDESKVGSQAFRGIRAELYKADVKSHQPYDIIALQETGEGASQMNLIMKDLLYMQYYDPGNGVSIAWNRYRFEATNKRGKEKVVGKPPDQYGDRFVVWIVLNEKKTERQFLALNYHGCIGCSPNYQKDVIFAKTQKILEDNKGCGNNSTIPLYFCDCQGGFSHAEFESRLRSCWNNFGKLNANKSPNACGFIDFIFYPTSKLQLIEQEKSFGSTRCGCSNCNACQGVWDSDHASVLALFKIV
jgi:hypothetical protein